MKRWGALLAVALVALLLYLTLSMSPDGPPVDASHTAEEAMEACQRGVLEQVAAADFSLSPTIEYRGDSVYAVVGVVDQVGDVTTTRRNYDCTVTFAGPAGYQIDSLSVWQSH